MTNAEYQRVYDALYKELVSVDLRKKLAHLVEHAGDPIAAERDAALAQIEAMRLERDEARDERARLRALNGNPCRFVEAGCEVKIYIIIGRTDSAGASRAARARSRAAHSRRQGGSMTIDPLIAELETLRGAREESRGNVMAADSAETERDAALGEVETLTKRLKIERDVRISEFERLRRLLRDATSFDSTSESRAELRKRERL